MKRMILFAAVLLILIPTVLIGYAVNYFAQTTIKTEKMDALAGTAHMMDQHLTEYYDCLIAEIKLNSGREEVRALLEAASAGKPVDRSEVEWILTEPAGFPIIGGSIIDSSGKIILSSQPDKEGLMLDKTDLYQSINSGKESYSGVVTNNDAADVFEIAVPIHDGQGNVIGILRQIADLSLLSGYLGSIDTGDSGYAFLIRNDGFMLFGREQKDNVILYHEYQNNSTLEQLVSDFKTNRLKEDRGTVSYTNEGINYTGVYEKVKSIDCIAVAVMNQNEMYVDLKNVGTALVSLALAILVIMTLFGYIIVRLHTAPIKMINDTLKKIADGDLTARCAIKEYNPFGKLSRNVNNLADSFQKNERELRMSSRIDNLTHLPNRNAIYEVLDTLLYKHPNQALLLLDLEGFKEINDNLGYDIGDRILMEVGDVLRELPQHVCYPSRLGGAEFLVFMSNWTAPKYPERIAKKIIKKIEGIRFIDEVHVDVGASIGIEYTEEDRIDKKKLIKFSNIAMHKARSIGRNSYFVHYPYLQKEQ